MSGEGKLVRDNVPHVVLTSGRTPICRTAAPEELVGLLRRKLLEEVGEFLDASPQTQAEELADVMEVVFALAHHIGMDTVLEIRDRKAKRLGRFDAGVVWAGNFEAPSAKEGSDVR